MIVTVRVASLPPKTMLAIGTRVGFEEVAVTVSPAAGVSASPTVKPSADVGVSSGVVDVGDVRDRRQVVRGGDRQDQGVARGAAVGIRHGDREVAVPL